MDIRTRSTSRDWDLWSSRCRLVVTDADALSPAARLVDDLLGQVEATCSRFRADSELMTLTRLEDGSAEVSPLLAELLADALEAARRTDGAVDPTLGAAMVALGYDVDLAEVQRRQSTTGANPVVVVRRLPGWRSVRLDGRHLEMPPGTQLDLGATAKAGAADRCARMVARRLGVGVLVSLGGDIATAGPGPEKGWQVLVQDLPDDVPQQISLASGAAVATSSNARRRWTQDGLPRHHLLDPRTGSPAASPWRSVSVVAPTALHANSASTAALVKGHEGLAFLRTTALPARLVSQEGTVVTLGGWPREAAA